MLLHRALDQREELVGAHAVGVERVDEREVTHRRVVRGLAAVAAAGDEAPRDDGHVARLLLAAADGGLPARIRERAGPDAEARLDLVVGARGCRARRDSTVNDSSGLSRDESWFALHGCVIVWFPISCPVASDPAASRRRRFAARVGEHVERRRARRDGRVIGMPTIELARARVVERDAHRGLGAIGIPRWCASSPAPCGGVLHCHELVPVEQTVDDALVA